MQPFVPKAKDIKEEENLAKKMQKDNTHERLFVSYQALNYFFIRGQIMTKLERFEDAYYSFSSALSVPNVGVGEMNEPLP